MRHFAGSRWLQSALEFSELESRRQRWQRAGEGQGGVEAQAGGQAGGETCRETGGETGGQSARNVGDARHIGDARQLRDARHARDRRKASKSTLLLGQLRARHVGDVGQARRTGHTRHIGHVRNRGNPWQGTLVVLLVLLRAMVTYVSMVLGLGGAQRHACNSRVREERGTGSAAGTSLGVALGGALGRLVGAARCHRGHGRHAVVRGVVLGSNLVHSIFLAVVGKGKGSGGSKNKTVEEQHWIGWVGGGMMIMVGRRDGPTRIYTPIPLTSRLLDLPRPDGLTNQFKPHFGESDYGYHTPELSLAKFLIKYFNPHIPIPKLGLRYSETV